ncbi:MAG TPA: hypothetical protein VIL44_00125 [Micromonospora sp.]
MADDLADPSERFRRRRAAPLKPTTGFPGSVALAPIPEQTRWAEELMALLRAQVGTAARHGVISAADSEQLLARLGLVIDQALTPR